MSAELKLHVSKASGLPFYRQIEDQIAEMIRTGHLAPGTRLPSVRNLARDSLVSLITVRRAYADLDRDGLIERRQGHGTFVADDVESASADRAFEQATEKLQQAITRSLQLGMTPDQIRAVTEGALSRD